jgi:hypothetical protein
MPADFANFENFNNTADFANFATFFCKFGRKELMACLYFAILLHAQGGTGASAPGLMAGAEVECFACEVIQVFF